MVRAKLGLTLGLVLLGAVIASSVIADTATKYPKGSTKLLISRGCKRVKPATVPRIYLKPQQLAAKGILFSDNFDGAFPGSWTPFSAPYFGPTTYRKVSGTKSAYCCQLGAGAVAAPGPYPVNFQGWITYGPFSLSGVASGKVAFQLWNLSETNYDTFFAGWSLDDADYEGSTWSGDTAGWSSQEVNLEDASYSNTYLGASQVYFSFNFASDESNTYEGAYVDDVSITTSSTSGTYTVSGIVKDQYNRPASGVVIYTSATNYQYTGLDGKYSFRLAPGTYTLVPKKPGFVFTPGTKSITVGAANVTQNFAARPATGDGVVKYWAVVVGIADYVGTGNDLNYCDDDARDMRAALIAAGWPAANIKMLIDSQGTKAAIKSAIATMATNADADDICLFFQSSHGDQGADIAPIDEPDNKDEFLCTYNILTEEIRDDELGQWLNKLKTRKYVVLIDTCYSGGNIKSLSRTGGFSFGEDIASAGSAGTVGTRDLDDNNAGVVVTACRDNELSEESGSLQNGVFAYYAVQGMTNGQADVNGDGWTSAEEVYNYSRPYVTIANGEQTVDMYDGYPGELNFAKLPSIILSSTPAANAASAAVGTNITLTFRNLVNQASAQSKFRLLTCTGTSVAGAFSWTTAKKTMVFNPTANLRAGDQYTVKILDGLALDSGTIMQRAESFTFNTAAAGVPALTMFAAAAPTASGASQITVNLSAAATVSGSVCNLAGREVAPLGSEACGRGVSTLLWNGKSSRGNAVPAGQYLVRLTAVDAKGNSASCLLALER